MIILLNGCINAGKSTVAQALVRLLKDASHIELDDLRHCMPALPFEGRVFAITLELPLRSPAYSFRMACIVS